MVSMSWYTYDEIHQAIRQLAQKIQASCTRYDAMIAIGGGGFIPARILRSFLNIPIYAITTAYYCNDQGHTTRDSVQKVQWLDPMSESLKGKHVLVVDEVDDSRVTLQFCLEQLQQEDFASLGVAVLHEKIKEKICTSAPEVAIAAAIVESAGSFPC